MLPFKEQTKMILSIIQFINPMAIIRAAQCDADAAPLTCAAGAYEIGRGHPRVILEDRKGFRADGGLYRLSCVTQAGQSTRLI